MDSACFIANGRDGGGNLSPLLTQTFQAKNIVIIIYQRAEFSLVPSKGAEGFPCVSWKGSVRRKGQRGWERLLPSKTSPAFRAKPPWGLAIRAGKMWTAAFCAFLFKVAWQWKTIRSGNAGQNEPVLCQKRGGPCNTREAFEGKLAAFPRIPAFSRLPCLEAATLVLLQANPLCRVSSDNVGISRDSQERTHNPLYDYYYSSFKNYIRWRREKLDSTHRREISCK